MLSKKCGNYKCDKFHRRNHENIKILWKAIENAPGFQSDSIWKVVDLSKIHLAKKHFYFEIKILILFQHPKYIISAEWRNGNILLINKIARITLRT